MISNLKKGFMKMSLLRSYSFGHVYGVTELTDDVLGLFVSLVESPNKKIEHASEIISAGLQNHIDFTKEFNIDAYEAKIRKNELLGKENKRKKESYLDFSDNSDDWDDTVASGGIKADVATTHAALQMKDAYEEIIMEDSLRYAIDTITSLRTELLVDAKLDIVRTIQQALKGIPDSIKALKLVCDEYDIVAEQIEVILSSGMEFEAMFA
jgi:hypothetical protein